MKVTDYCPRAAPFDTYLTGRDLVGVEVGVDVGAHAEAMLRYCSIAKLHLVDVWPKDYHFGFCQGRLCEFRSRFEMHAASSERAALGFGNASLDFVYIDQEHDETIVAADLSNWWPTIKPGGVLGYRNYVGRGTPLDKAIDAFIAKTGESVIVNVEVGEIVLTKR